MIRDLDPMQDHSAFTKNSTHIDWVGSDQSKRYFSELNEIETD